MANHYLGNRVDGEDEVVPTIADHLGDIDIDTPAGELLRRATAPIRHEARVEATMRAARAWAANMLPEEDPSAARVDTAVAILLLADLIGIGGEMGLGGDGARTDRHPAFRELGKGRRQASDGDAYMVAVGEALGRAIGAYGTQLRFTPHIPADNLGGEWDVSAEIFDAPNGPPGIPRVDVGDVLSADWARPLIGRGLIRARETAWVEEAPLFIEGLGTLQIFIVRGETAEWAKVYDAFDDEDD